MSGNGWKLGRYKTLIVRLGAGLGLLAVVGFAGCAKRLPIALIPEIADSADYFSELEKWRRTAKIYAKMDIRCYVEAILLSEPLMRAYVREYAEVYGLSLEEQRQLYQEKVVPTLSQDTFFVSLFAPQDNWVKLGVKDDVWKVRAVYAPGGEELQAAVVQEVSIKDAKRAYFFPKAPEWSSHYHVTMTTPTGASEVALRLQSVVANEEFSWRKEQ